MESTNKKLTRKGFVDIGVLLIIGALSFITGIGGGMFAGKIIKNQNIPSSLGAVIATTSLSDTINTFRTNVNTSLENINNELSAVSSTVGTLGDPVGIAHGGLGSSTLPSDGQFLGANGTSTKWKNIVGSGAITVTTSTTSTVISTSGFDATLDINFSGNNTHSGNETFSTATSSSTSTDPFNLLPAGTIQMYASSSAPAGWLLADGTAYSTSSYPRLFYVIGYTYGSSTLQFKVPDFRGKTARGYGSAVTSTDSIGKTGGEETHVQTLDELAAHSHTINNYIASNTPGSGAIPSNNEIVDGQSSIISTTGSSTPFNVLDPYLTVNYIIKY